AEYLFGCALGERVGPSDGPHRVAVDERVRNRLGRDECIRHDATEQILRAADAERFRLSSEQRVVRDEIEGVRVGGARVVIATERPAHYVRKAVGNVDARLSVVAYRYVGAARVVRDERPDFEFGRVGM